MHTNRLITLNSHLPTTKTPPASFHVVSVTTDSSCAVCTLGGLISPVAWSISDHAGLPGISEGPVNTNWRPSQNLY